MLSLMPLSECGFEIVFVVFCDIRAAEGGGCGTNPACRFVGVLIKGGFNSPPLGA